MARVTTSLLLLAGLAASASAGASELPAEAAAAPRTFALIVGNNASPKPELPALRYADDDAVKFSLLFGASGSQRLLTVLDDESQALFADQVAQARVPSRAALLEARDALFAEIRAARAAGHATAFYFVYSGHGDVGPSQEGVLFLGRDSLTRGELFRELVAPSPADINHLLIDACNAYFMVKRRGTVDDEPAEDVAPLVQDFLARADLGSYPGTGVVVATSSEAETHEWSRFDGGVFSHELRSGLLGSADLDGDGQVRYDEIAAYLAAANARVDNPKAKIRYYAEAPARDRHLPLLVYRDPGGATPTGALLLLDAAEAGRFYVEDGRGTRYADFHKSAEAPLQLWLLPGTRYYLRGADFEAELPDSAATVSLAGLARRPLDQAAVRQRGAIDDALRKGLYALPYSPSFKEGYDQLSDPARRALAMGPMPTPASHASTRAQPRDRAPRLLTIVGGSTLGAGALSALGGGVALKLYLDDSAAFARAATLDDKLALRERLGVESAAATALFGVAGAVAVAGAGALLVDLLFADPATSD